MRSAEINIFLFRYLRDKVASEFGCVPRRYADQRIMFCFYQLCYRTSAARSDIAS